MMKKRVLKIIALLAALALIVGVCWFANGLVGNPISKSVAKNTAEKYLNDNYSDKDYVLDGVVFSFKHGYYHAYISSPSSMDSSFSLAIGADGRLIYDYYEDRVVKRWNTADRIGKEYRNVVDGVFDSLSFPYDEHIGYGDLAFVPREYKNDSSVPDYAIVTDDLILDAFYDVNELGAGAGKLTVYIEDDTVSAERLAEILLDIRSVFDDAGVRFGFIDCVLEYPKPEDGKRREGRVEVMDLPYSDIREEGMVERVKASDDAAKAYYAEQDAEKYKEKYDGENELTVVR